MKTSRLILRSLETRDADQIALLAGDFEVASKTGRIPYPYSREAALQWLTGLDEGERVYCIEFAGALTGLCGYTLRADGSAEIGYWLGKPYWGRGFATEAVRALMDFGFTKGGVKRFTSGHFTDNPASGRVLTKLGFKKTGEEMRWSETLQRDLAAFAYERRRPFVFAIRALAS